MLYVKIKAMSIVDNICVFKLINTFEIYSSNKPNAFSELLKRVQRVLSVPK